VKKSTLTWTVLMILVVAGTMAIVPDLVLGHCQIPCGIYDDPARVASLYEDATTIEKSITEIIALNDKTDVQSRNQLIRWVNNKDEHAAKIITLVSEYFLAQRIKPVAPEDDGYAAYLQELAEHHAVIVAAMQTKQHADTEYVAKLRAAIDAIAPYYASE